MEIAIDARCQSRSSTCACQGRGAGQLARAAKRLNLAQPTVSLQIQDLETRLGVRLVDRLGKRAFATAAGRELIEHAQRIAQETERLLAPCAVTATAGSARCASARAPRR